MRAQVAPAAAGGAGEVQEAGTPADGTTLSVRAVHVGRAEVIGTGRDGRPVTSAIRKRPVTAATVDVGRARLAGDEQADLVAHGGPDKVVYAYPAAHYEGWRAAGFVLVPGGLGENVVLAGAGEADVRIGDVWAWGDAVLQVSQPRSPCYKLAVHVGRRGTGAEMVRTGRCGWYLRTLVPGPAPTRGPVAVVASDAGEPTVAEAFAAATGPPDPALVARVVASAHLAEQWRDGVRRLRERSA